MFQKRYRDSLKWGDLCSSSRRTCLGKEKGVFCTVVLLLIQNETAWHRLRLLLGLFGVSLVKVGLSKLRISWDK